MLIAHKFFNFFILAMETGIVIDFIVNFLIIIMFIINVNNFLHYFNVCYLEIDFCSDIIFLQF